MITALLFLYVGGSAYAECIVDGTSYDVGGTGVTTVDRSNLWDRRYWEVSGQTTVYRNAGGFSGVRIHARSVFYFPEFKKNFLENFPTKI